MKAIVRSEYGGPEVLRLEEVAKPTPKDNEVLVRVQTAAVNPLDWHMMRASPFLVRLGGGFFKPKDTGLGADIAGWVEAVGKDVTDFRPGDEVFGEIGSGGFAEFVCAPQERVTLKPPNVSFEHAAATPVVGLTAIQGLRDTGNIQRGERVLVNGASGGIGTFAVQYAKCVGAQVTGVCSTRNLEMVRSIGADAVIDYTRQDFTLGGEQYDLIFDTIGNRSSAEHERALVPGGRCVIAGFTTISGLLNHALMGGWAGRKGKKKIGLMPVATPRKKDLVTIGELLERKQVVPVIDRCYPLAETAEAVRYLETGRARGKVIVMVGA